MSPGPRISVIVPTYQRRALVVRLVHLLGSQEYAHGFEAIVVVDGSTDDTEAGLAALHPRFPLQVISQPNSGPARARNRGAEAARGDIFLFLDDDMEPDPHLLAEHDRCYADGADTVSGVMPLHPDSPSTLLTDGVRFWAEDLARRLSQSGYGPRVDELVSGQLSVRRDVFTQLGGFDEHFTAQGSYGNEDLDFAHRLVGAGYRSMHNPRAISWQRYVVDAASHLRQYGQVGQADVAIIRKHPELFESVVASKLADSEIHRWTRQVVRGAPRLADLTSRLLEPWIARRVDGGRRDRGTAWLFFALRSVRYWLGVARAGGIPRARPMRVLSYHAIADLSGDPVLEQYGVPPSSFQQQLVTMQRAGFHFITADEFIRFLGGEGGLPRRAVLLTFDDCYQDLADNALPLLRQLRIPAVAFAVSGLVGGLNEWDLRVGRRALRLLDSSGLRQLVQNWVEIGAHSCTHPNLTTISDAQLADETVGSAAQLATLAHHPVRLFAYPYGAHDARVHQAVRAAGFAAAFTVDPGWVHPGRDRYTVPRVEIMRRDVGWRFRLKLGVAGRSLRPRLGIRRRLRQWLGPRHSPGGVSAALPDEETRARSPAAAQDRAAHREPTAGSP
ncbi:MAG TPA: polysaccharide deacetylase family protein [Gemmatimonadales bacterium]|nr:polysaccharide deacetylase family protein [Gemmatimonadales bacterium]